MILVVTVTTEMYTLSLHDALPISDIYSATGGQGALGSTGQAMMRGGEAMGGKLAGAAGVVGIVTTTIVAAVGKGIQRSEEHTSELQSHSDIVCRLLLEKKTQNGTK